MKKQKYRYKRIISVLLKKRVLSFLFIAFGFQALLFPMPTLADEAVASELAQSEGNALEILHQQAEDEITIINHLPENPDAKILSESLRTITAYNSEAAQCDDSPCITANGFNVCKHGEEDTIAANFLPFGTKVKIPDLFGDKVFIVRDRMNQRFDDRVDVWMLHKADAKQFGVQVSKIQVIE
ncbi:MAG: 3D domain-containing protein [Planctomycetes bacterium]|jgi:3D (Asp-Asp-Asp) domain-containing protein|nr:3D domain-containing protein [Planctomycetota bacterium]